MEIKFLNQPKDIKLGEVLIKKLESGKFSRIWIFAGFAKDSGVDYLLEAIKKAKESGTMVECILGLDKKNTSKDMLLRLLNLGCKIRFYINGDDSKLETRIYVFESDENKSYVYLTGAKLSEGGLTENMALITEISYEYSEKMEFNKVKANMENGITSEDFKVLNEDILKELASAGEILARIIERKIPSIKELYQNGGVDIGVQEYDESASGEYDKIEKSDFDIAIDIAPTKEVKVQDSLGIEVEHMIKKKAKEEKVVSKIVINDKESNYEKMNTLILPTNKVLKKGVTAHEIKIPTSIAERIYKFIEYPNLFSEEIDEKGKLREVQEIKLEIFENVTKQEIIDENAKLIKTEKGLVIKSVKFIEYDINENDIMRFIKNKSGEYRCEIIKQESSEYNIWENFCKNTTRGSGKKYGII